MLTSTSAEDDPYDECAICKEDTDCDFVTRCGHWFHKMAASQHDSKEIVEKLFQKQGRQIGPRSFN